MPTVLPTRGPLVVGPVRSREVPVSKRNYHPYVKLSAKGVSRDRPPPFLCWLPDIAFRLSTNNQRLKGARIVWRDSLSRLVPFLILSSLILWFCQDLILQEQVPFFRDLGPYFYPLRFALYESFRAGELPLWNRHMAMGFPLLAAFQSGVFYPPHLLLLVLPFFSAIRVIFILHFLIAGTGAYYFCRSWRFPPYLSIVGALLFGLGGTVVSLTNLSNHFQTAVWLPWVIFFWERVLRSTSWKNFLAFTLITAMQFVAGSPELFAISMVLVLLDGMRVKQSMPTISSVKVWSILLAANLLVLGLVMVQVLPTVELFLESRRQQPIPPQEAFHWSLKPASLLNLFFLDKEIDLTTSKGIRLFFGQEAPLFLSYYLGAISVFGISLWSYFSSLREKITVLTLVTASLIVALGSYTPIYPFLFRHIPFLGVFRFPEKLFFFPYVLFLYMALKGLGDLLLHDEGSIKRPFVILAAVCVFWVALSILFNFNLDLLARLIAAQSRNPLSSSDHAKMVAAALSNLDRQVVLSLGFLLLITLVKTKAIRLPLFGVLMVSAVFVDLAWAHKGFLFPVNPGFVYESELVAQTRETDPNRFFYFPSGRDLHPSSVTVLGRPTLQESIAVSFKNLLPNAGLLYSVDYFQEIDALGRQPYTDFLFFANQLDFTSQLKLLRTFNVKYLVAFQSLPEEGTRLIGRFPDSFSWLYKIEGTIPRAYIVDKILVGKDSKEVLRQLSSAAFDPTREVVLDSEIPMSPSRQLNGTAKIVRYENELVTIATSTHNEGILVLADSYYPGWKAFVDGREEVIRKANLFFRAVPLPAGNHTVEFRYEPRSFMIGLIVSATTLITLIVVTILFTFAGQRRESSFTIPISIKHKKKSV
jgi:Bacterial membrane protein YfhO